MVSHYIKYPEKNVAQNEGSPYYDSACDYRRHFEYVDKEPEEKHTEE